MVGFYLPEDPYFPNNGNGGWIEEDPEEQIKVDAPAVKEDPKEGHDDEENSDEDQREEDSDAESEVSNPPFVVCDLPDLAPEPSFQVYRHPGGTLWMRTLRKRMLPFHRPEILLIEVPF